MNAIKRIFGIVWMLLAPTAVFFIVQQAGKKLDAASEKIAAATTDVARVAAEAAHTNTLLQWGIIFTIFLPIAFGFVLFGKYALQGEYDQ